MTGNIDTSDLRDRATARLFGDRYYRSTPCRRCGHVVRRVANAHCVNCTSEYANAWKASRLGQERARKRKWRKANRETVNASKRKARASRAAETLQKKRDRADLRAIRAGYRRLLHRAHIAARRLPDNPVDRTAAKRLSWRRMRALRRARKRSADGAYTNEQAHFILQLQNGHCAYCQSTVDLCVDHMVALSRGGSNHGHNIQWLCKPCNDAKGARSDDEYRSLRNIEHRNSAADWVRMLWRVLDC